jgi:hypothetical protein
MNQRIEWVRREHISRRLILDLNKSSYTNTGDRKPLMSAGILPNGKPSIQIYGARFWSMINVSRSLVENPELQKNMFAIALVREAVHLEQLKSVMTRTS